MLMNKNVFLSQVAATCEQKNWLLTELQKITGIKTWPTSTNFLTFSNGAKSAELFESIQKHDIAIRDVGAHPLLKNHLRVSIGSPQQNQLFLAAVQEFMQKN